MHHASDYGFEPVQYPSADRHGTTDLPFIFHYDGGHGWLEVPAQAFRDLGLMALDFSRYSYRHGNTFYLEEDCDATKFITMFFRRYGQNPAIKEINDGYNSPIRSYARIHTNGGA
jgi:hypothetical protein